MRVICPLLLMRNHLGEDEELMCEDRCAWFTSNGMCAIRNISENLDLASNGLDILAKKE